MGQALLISVPNTTLLANLFTEFGKSGLYFMLKTLSAFPWDVIWVICLIYSFLMTLFDAEVTTIWS